MPEQERCRICGKALPGGKDTPTYPFCGKRCKIIDLNRWMSGDYLISEPLPQDEVDRYSESRQDED